MYSVSYLRFRYAVLKVVMTHIFQWFRFRSGLYRVIEEKTEE